MKIASPYSIIKWIFLLLILSQFIECKRSGDGCPGKIIDSTHFDSSEKAKIPDWLGDSLFFYSDAGDTAYLVCTGQYGGYQLYGTVAGLDAECGQYYFPYYPEYGYTYLSNHPDLNGIRVVIYKESNAYQIFPGPPTSYFLINKIDRNKLANLEGNNAPTDSVFLNNGIYEYGWFTFSKGVSINLSVGLIRINRGSKRWTIYKYKLNK